MNRFLFVFPLLLISCVSIEVDLVMDPPPKPKKNPEEVEVFYILPDKEIKLIGSLNIFYGEGYERKFAIRSLRKKASSLGADFILIDLVKKKKC